MNAETILQLIAIVLGSNWVGSLLLEVYKTKRKKKTPTDIILRCVSRYHLLASAEKYKQQGYIDNEEYNDIYEEYNAYRELEGNGRVKREYEEELKKLPIK